MRRFAICCLALPLLVLPQSALARDRDRDRLPDAWERQHHLSVAKNSAEGDPDRDRVDNRNELREGTKPRDRDSDNDRRPDGREDLDHDGLSNAAEDLTGNDPRLRDSDGDGTRDGKEPAGVVTGFHDGLLTITLVRGGAVTVLVTEDTEVECESEASIEAGYVGPVQRAKNRKGKRARRGKRAKKDARAALLVAPDAGAQASQLEGEEGEEEGGVEEEIEEEDASEEDDLSEDDEGDDGEEGEDDHLAACAALLRPGTRVRDADVDTESEDGLALEYVALVR